VQLFLKKDEYSSINGYADAILDYAAHHETENTLIHKYATEDDRLNGIDAIDGFVPYKPYSREQICEGIRLLKSIQLVKCVCLLPKNLDFMRVSGSVVMNTRTTNPPISYDFGGFLQLFGRFVCSTKMPDPQLDPHGERAGNVQRAKADAPESRVPCPPARLFLYRTSAMKPPIRLAASFCISFVTLV